MRLLALLVGAVFLGDPATAQQAPGPIGTPEGQWRTQIHWIPMTDAANVRHLLYARVCWPLGEAPARTVVIEHGSTLEATARLDMRPVACENEAARWFLSRGFVVIASMRRGFGATGGEFAEYQGECGYTHYDRSARESARDVAATVDYAATLSFARPQGIVVVGHSAGGWATLGYNALPHPRVTAIINMAGGRGSHTNGIPNNICQPEALVAAAGELARGATTPMLWVYAENDSYFAPPIAAAMYAAYAQNSGNADFHQLGPFGNDGHGLFFGRGGSAIWGPLVERYLATRPAQ
jgi:pimeloyl-ACP methyl ester carboxylesterase